MILALAISIKLADGLITSATMTFIIASGAVCWFVIHSRFQRLMPSLLQLFTHTKLILALLEVFFCCGLFMDLFALIVIMGPILITLTSFNIDLVTLVCCIMATQVPSWPHFWPQSLCIYGCYQTGLETSQPHCPIFNLSNYIGDCLVPQLSLWLPQNMRWAALFHSPYGFLILRVTVREFFIEASYRFKAVFKMIKNGAIGKSIQGEMKYKRRINASNVEYKINI